MSGIGPEPGPAAELHRLRRRVNQLQEALAASRSEVQALLNSYSFRITAPLRWVRSRLSGARAADVVHTTAGKEDSGTSMSLFRKELRSSESRPSGANDNYHPLDFDDALAPLVGLPVIDGEVSAASQDGTCFWGRGEPALRIATVIGRELREELAFDAAVIPLRRDGWLQQLQRGGIDFLLLETAWDPEGGWDFAMVGGQSHREALLALLGTCRSMAVPVVLWAREDAANFANFAWLLTEVDRVYAIDEPLQKHILKELPGKRVGLLPVALQPRLYNPIRSYPLQRQLAATCDKVVLDGWWSLDRAIVPLLEELAERLLVLDSEWDFARERVENSSLFRDSVIGCMTPLEKAAICKLVAGEVFRPDRLILPWRQKLMMLRSSACGALAVHAAGGQGQVESMPGNGLQPLRDALANPILRMRAAHRAWRDALAGHCLADRLQQIADDLQLEAAVVPAPMHVAIVLVTMRPERFAACLQWFRADTWPDKELIVVLHGRAEHSAALEALVRPGEPVRFVQLGSERSLGDCLNYALALSDAPFWMKVDDDDHYGPNYVADMMLHRRAIAAPLMGKPPVFLHLEAHDELCWDPVWAAHAHLLHPAASADSALVAGGTLCGIREVAEKVRFSSRRRGGSDSDFILRSHEAGYSLLATDGFNFARYRSAAEGFHTWQVPYATLRARTRPLGQSSRILLDVFI